MSWICPTRLFFFSRYRYQEDDSGNEVPSNVNNNNSPPAAPYDKKLKLQMTSRKYSSEAENDTENGGDLIGKLLGIPDKTIINKLLSSADEAAKFFGVKKWEYALVLVTPARLILAPRGLKIPLCNTNNGEENKSCTTPSINE